VSAERKKWQAKGKALPAEMVTIATQTDHIQEPTVVQVEDGTQTKVALEQLEKAMERKREKKGKGRAKDSEDTVMKDESDNSDSYREMYEDLSGYEDEDEALVAAPLATKKQAAHIQQQDRLGSDPDQPKHPLGAHLLTITDR